MYEHNHLSCLENTVALPTLLIITGRSGSGKSTAIAALEDAGFYCVDNMPVAMLPKFLELPLEGAADAAGFAFVMDLREKGFLSSYKTILGSLHDKGYPIEIVFLEADRETLLRRYSQSRRQHPLARKGRTLSHAIEAEKEKLEDLRGEAEYVINTSQSSVHDLKGMIHDIAKKSVELAPMRVDIMSFGFKFGSPREADLIMDVRFLPNPYFEPSLKLLDGETEAVQSFVLNNRQTRLFLDKFLNLLDYLIPLYKKEGKAYLTIAVGCTGGRHRSVVVARQLFEHLKQVEHRVELNHRDIHQR